MVIKAFIVCMVLVGIALVITEAHRYQVYKEDIEREQSSDGR
nr:MAG TPA: putative integral membrane protein [Caudoviricetes sp.]